MNKPLNVAARARMYYEAMAEDITLRYPCLPMPDWDNAGEEIQEVAREIARARVHSEPWPRHTVAATRARRADGRDLRTRHAR